MTSDLIKDGWFSEFGAMWPGQAMSLKVNEVLYEGKSKFQDILVFNNKEYGNVLVLDGVIQATERDEFAYQEMITHIPMFAHPNPEHVLIIGGGDGGVLREVVKHECVKTVTICEIDEGVIEASKKFMPSMAVGFQHPKVTVHIGDGMKFMSDRPGFYDVIITDSSDPIGPAESLFEEPYYKLLSEALKPGGVVCCQGENLFLHLDTIRSVIDFSRQHYPHVQYAYTMVPTYPNGSIGFVLCGVSCKEPVRSDEKVVCKYYNPEIHRAAFVLPQFAKEGLGL